jgi:hypothetical protein
VEKHMDEKPPLCCEVHPVYLIKGVCSKCEAKKRGEVLKKASTLLNHLAEKNKKKKKKF